VCPFARRRAPSSKPQLGFPAQNRPSPTKEPHQRNKIDCGPRAHRPSTAGPGSRSAHAGPQLETPAPQPGSPAQNPRSAIGPERRKIKKALITPPHHKSPPPRQTSTGASGWRNRAREEGRALGLQAIASALNGATSTQARHRIIPCFYYF
jgi:hypothetical protein